MFGVSHDLAEKLISKMISSNREEVKYCNLCGSGQYRILFQVGSQRPLTSVICSSCGLTRLLETLPKDKLENIGKHGGSLVRGLEMSRGLKALYFQNQLLKSKSIINYLTQYIGPLKGKRALDLISETGGFVQALNNQGCMAEGIDLSSQSEFGISKGLTIHRSHILDFNPNKKYDIITGVRFINHFSDIKAVMKKLKSLLSKQGVIYFETLDIEHALRRKSLVKCIKADHPYMFTQESFKALCAKTGFKLINIERDSDAVTDFSSLNHIHTLITHQTSADNKYKINISHQYEKLTSAHIAYLSSSVDKLTFLQSHTLKNKIMFQIRNVLRFIKLEVPILNLKYHMLAYIKSRHTLGD